MLTRQSDERDPAGTTADRTPELGRLRRFISAMGALIDASRREIRILEGGKALLTDLIAHDDWLPDAYAQPHPDRYQQYLLHCDSRERFSVVSFVWGPGQTTPIHNHRVWGLVGVLRGAERVESFERKAAGLRPSGTAQILPTGAVDAVSPRIGDIHRVTNAFEDRVSISIHVYGANIGTVERSIYAPDGTASPFVSGYTDTALPNLWQPTPPGRWVT
jgi:predicted metal-dependent enzyme (double-stranded beta helix superfamily)